MVLPRASALLELHCLRKLGSPGHRRRPRPDLSTGQSGSSRPCRCAAPAQRRPLRRSGPARGQCVGLARRPSRAVAVYHSMLTAGTHLAAEGLAAEAGAGRHTPSANAARHQLAVRSRHRGGACSEVPRMTGRRGPAAGLSPGLQLSRLGRLRGPESAVWEADVWRGHERRAMLACPARAAHLGVHH